MTTDTPSPKGDMWLGIDDTRNSKEDALSENEFELLVEGTYQLDGDYYELESRLVIFLAGRLGLRAGEIAHMDSDWVDWSRGMLVIPRHERCTDGRDGGICGHCRGNASQMVEHNSGLTQEEAEEMMWSPKTESSVREIPLEASTRARIILERYFDRFDEFKASRSVVNRRVTRAAEAADGIDSSSIYPHALRATCASHFASRGIDVVSLKSMMGWADYQAAESYLAESGERTERAIRRL